MKKVLKLSSLLAAVLLLTVLAGVQLLSAQQAIIDVDIDQDFVSDADESPGADNTFLVTITESEGHEAGATLSASVTNRNTKVTKDIEATPTTNGSRVDG